ncbi:hypothetical protein IMZ48_49330 [Candidatus Bathyarchaeota archaeon]|nr:hypothetical protein [Candidatus Bathyarchaeota archaeon]
MLCNEAILPLFFLLLLFSFIILFIILVIARVILINIRIRPNNAIEE